METRERAEAWAIELLAKGPGPAGRTERTRERVRVQKRLDRQLYQATFRIWEPAGSVQVSLDARGGAPLEVRYPVAGVDVEPLGAWLGERGEICALALERAREAFPEAQVRVAGIERARAPRGREHALVRIEQAPPDGVLTVEIDPRTGERVGFQCLPFFRGSKRSGALNRITMVRRARAAVELPPGARLVYTRLVNRGLGRLWRLRWEVRRGERVGWIKAALNARTGWLCESSRALRTGEAIRDEVRAPHAEAERAIRFAAQVRFGGQAQVGGVVDGAVRVGGELIPGWLAVVEAGDATVRATLARGRVRFSRARATRRLA